MGFSSSVLVGVILTPTILAGADRVESVCALLRDAESKHGQTTRVLGVYHSDSEGTDLYDPACRDQLQLRGQAWTSALWLAKPGDPIRIPGSSQPFDDASYQQLATAVVEAKTKGGSVKAMFEGHFEYCPVFRTVRPGFAKWIGCGHMAAYPAQIVIQKVSDIGIVAGDPPRR